MVLAKHADDHWDIEQHDEDLLHANSGKIRFRKLSTVLAKILLTKRQVMKLDDQLFTLTKNLHDMDPIEKNYNMYDEERLLEEVPEVTPADCEPTSDTDAAEDIATTTERQRHAEEDGDGYIITAEDEEERLIQQPQSSRRAAVSNNKTTLTEENVDDTSIANLKSKVLTQHKHLDQLTKEMCLICANLEMVHRASVLVLHAVFNDYGLTVLPLLVKVLDTVSPVSSMGQDDDEFVKHSSSQHNENINDEELGAVGNVIKILSYFSQSEETRYHIVNQKGMLRALIAIMNGNGVSQACENECVEPLEEGNDESRKESVIKGEPGQLYPYKTRLHLLGLIANLTCREENPEIILSHEQFMPALISVAKDDPIEQVRQYAIVAIANIANTIRVASSLASVPGLTELLCEGSNDTNPITRMYVVNILAQLCSHEVNIPGLATYNDGAIITLLILVMTTKENHNDDSRIQAGSALVKLARHINISYSISNGEHLRLLAKTAVQDHNVSIRVKATEILKEFSQYMPPNSELLNALVIATTTRDPGSRCSIAEALQHQSKVGNRKAMAEHVGVVNALIELATIDDEDYDTCSIQTRDAAVGTINGLASKAANRPLLAKHQKLIIALVKAVSRENENARLSSSLDRNACGPPSPITMDSSQLDQGIKWTKTKRTLLSLVEKM